MRVYYLHVLTCFYIYIEREEQDDNDDVWLGTV